MVVSIFGILNTNSQEVKFGVKGGFNLTTITDNNIDKYDLAPAFNFGFMAEFLISDKFSFQPELLFSGQGFNQNSSLTPNNYINVPLIGKYYLSENFSLEAGPQIGFLTSKENDTFNSVDVGVNFGLGYKFTNGLNFGARYNVGLNNISTVQTSKNRVLQFTVGYFF